MTKKFEDKMVSAVKHLESEYSSVRAGRANPGVLDKVTVDYYGVATPINQVATVSVTEARTLSIQPWDRSLLKAITKAIQMSDVGINPIDDGVSIRLNFPAPTEERRKALAKDVSKEQIVAMAAAIKEAINELHMENKNSRVIPEVTISQGYSCFIPEKEVELSDMLAMADKVLYKVKEHGRNGYEVY